MHLQVCSYFVLQLGLTLFHPQFSASSILVDTHICMDKENELKWHRTLNDITSTPKPSLTSHPGAPLFSKTTWVIHTHKRFHSLQLLCSCSSWRCCTAHFLNCACLHETLSSILDQIYVRFCGVTSQWFWNLHDVFLQLFNNELHFCFCCLVLPFLIRISSYKIFFFDGRIKVYNSGTTCDNR